MTTDSKGARTRRHILRSAADRFAETGYHGTSYADLVEASGLSKGAHYFHFPSKQELALEVCRSRQREVMDLSTDAARGEASPLERLFKVLRARAQAFAEERSLRCLPRLTSDFARDPELCAHVAGMHGTAIAFFEGLLREASLAGELREGLDPAPTARTLFAALVGMDELSERESAGRDLLGRSQELEVLFRTALTRPVTSQPSSGRTPE